MNRITLYGFALTTGLAISAPAQARLYVDDNAPGDPGPGDPTISDPLEDGSAGRPFDSIQKAVDAAVSGDGILLLDGRYAGTGNHAVNFGGKSLSIIGVGGPERCIIDAEGNPSVFSSAGASSTLYRGFTIRGVGDGSGSAIQIVSGNVIVENCVFDQNTKTDGFNAPAIRTQNTGPVIRNCVFTRNTTTGGVVHSSLGGTPTYINCTFAGNSGVAVLCTASNQTEVKNSILWGNTAAASLAGSTGSLELAYSIVEGGAAGVIPGGGALIYGPGNTSADPLFVDMASGDPHIRADSPAIDTGDATAASGIAIDFEGGPRPNGAGVDRGADEFGLRIYWVGDATPGGNIILRVVGTPGDDITLLASSTILTTPIPTARGPYWLGPLLYSPPPSLGTLPASGFVQRGTPIPAATAPFTRTGWQVGVLGGPLSNLSVTEIF